MVKKTIYILFILHFLLLFFSSCHQRKRPILELSIENYEFGCIKKDTIYKGSSVITNSGNAALIIENINPGCGCTSVHISKDTILSKDTCSLTFTYKTYGKIGFQESFITIVANTDSLIHVLTIHANVIDSILQIKNSGKQP